MNDIGTILVRYSIIAVAAFFAFNILIAALKGMLGAGKKIRENSPSFFEKVFHSIVAGVAGGIIVAVFTGADFHFTGAATMGISVGNFIKETLCDHH